jgi:hypothetical protein
MRQRDPAEREALEALHDRDPEPYLEFAQQQATLATPGGEADALAAILADWDRARRQHGPAQAAMIARDNATRVIPQFMRQRTPPPRVLLDRASDDDRRPGFRIGDRVIACRNDRYRAIDNGTLGTVSDIDYRTGAPHRRHGLR